VIGSQYSIPAQIGNYGWALLRAGEVDRARPYLLQAAQLFADMGLDDYAERHMQAAGIPTDRAELRALLEQAAAQLRQQEGSEQFVEVLTALYELAQEQEDWPAVASTAEELISLNAADAEIWAALADARSNQGNEAGAIEAYSHAITLDPAQAILRRNYANSLIGLGRLDEATGQLDVAEALDAHAPYLALRRAELAKARGDQAEAARWAEEALRRQPDWDEAQTLLDWARG
jgi:tetratricopeptide (TPR) repeat protein